MKVDLYKSFVESLDVLPSFERDLFLLHYLYGVTQIEIASLFKVSQPTICYRIGRGWERLVFRSNRALFRDVDLANEFRKALPEEDVQICLWYVKTTSQSAVAQKFGYSQGLVRYRLFRSSEILKKNEQSFYAGLINYVSDNLILGKVVKSKGRI